MAGFNQPQRHPTTPLASAAYRAGLTLHQDGGQLFLSRFGHHVRIRPIAGQWWIDAPDAPSSKAVGPIEDEDALMVAASEALAAASARSRQSLVQGR
ncbi:hypothetical protein [Nocardiopsis synnemataformans]|uniref:hypothetical protein n=1 Tax=Nocardiopsis synnemataformans TaxID=61305 RepID=UPI003EBC90A5